MFLQASGEGPVLSPSVHPAPVPVKVLPLCMTTFLVGNFIICLQESSPSLCLLSLAFSLWVHLCILDQFLGCVQTVACTVGPEYWDAPEVLLHDFRHQLLFKQWCLKLRRFLSPAAWADTPNGQMAHLPDFLSAKVTSLLDQESFSCLPLPEFSQIRQCWLEALGTQVHRHWLHGHHYTEDNQ